MHACIVMGKDDQVVRLRYEGNDWRVSAVK